LTAADVAFKAPKFEAQPICLAGVERLQDWYRRKILEKVTGVEAASLYMDVVDRVFQDFQCIGRDASDPNDP
jgi:hypothetical protein